MQKKASYTKKKSGTPMTNRGKTSANLARPSEKRSTEKQSAGDTKGLGNGKREQRKPYQNTDVVKITCKELDENGKGLVTCQGQTRKQYAVAGILEGESGTAVVRHRQKDVFLQLASITEPSKNRVKPTCPYFEQCGGCQLQHMSYAAQLTYKQKRIQKLLGGFGRVKSIIGMKDPWHYRNKVHAVVAEDEKGRPYTGFYAENSHRVIAAEECRIEDKKADEIIGTIRDMMPSYRMRAYQEDTGNGFLRHILVKRGFATNEIMVVLVTASSVFPGKNQFIKDLRNRHPEITTIVQNINNRQTSMVLGDMEKVLYGRGYIMDRLSNCTFRISAKSFYQVNPVQTEVLYQQAIQMAGLTGKETVIDAYCGIGTIGLIASGHAKEVIGVELNQDAVRDARENAKENAISNARFYHSDAGVFMRQMAAEKKQADVVFMDPPRSGSDEQFLSAVMELAPKRIVYISCNPETLARDLKYLTGKGRYEVKGIQGVDMFAMAGHCEVCVELCRK